MKFTVESISVDKLIQQPILAVKHVLKSKVVQINSRNIKTTRITVNTRGLYVNPGRNGC